MKDVVGAGTFDSEALIKKVFKRLELQHHPQIHAADGMELPDIFTDLVKMRSKPERRFIIGGLTCAWWDLEGAKPENLSRSLPVCGE
ncbi:hypothetical protein ACP4OV_031316 [Aristida adscensionis]